MDWPNLTSFSRLPKEFVSLQSVVETADINPTERSGVTCWRILHVWVYLLKNRPVKQKDARLREAGLSAESMS